MTTITVLQNQTIYDLAMKYYGGQEGVFDITKINSINFSTVLVPGQQLVIDETKRAAIERTNRKPISNIASTIYRATITGGQSVYDLATQHYGSVDALFALFKTSGVGFKTTLKGGDRLAILREANAGSILIRK
jgi:LysM repeat protein